MEKDFLCVDCENPTHRLILLHGWGADAEDLIPLGKELLANLEINFQLVSLRAPILKKDGIGREWYGLFPSDWPAVPDATKDLRKRLNKFSLSPIPLSKTFLLGFSQGGAMALATGCEFSFAGLIICSGYPHRDWSPQKDVPPILLTHGNCDEVVPSYASEKIFNLLKANHSICDLHIFNGGHEINFGAIDKISSFIRSRIE